MNFGKAFLFPIIIAGFNLKYQQPKRRFYRIFYYLRYTNMPLVKKILFAFFLLFMINEAGAKEFSSMAAYLKIFPETLPNGKDGNWLKSDRLKNTSAWNNANKVNIRLSNGYKEYTDIAERSAFYTWFQHQTDSLGFETKWSYAAAITTKKLEKLLTSPAKLTGISNSEICTFVTEGSQVIFDDIWHDLRLLYISKPLSGKVAETWDANLLLKEQNLIEPYYQKLSASTIKRLEKLLRKENFFSRLMPGYEFEGRLLILRDRWYYGMKMMHYQNQKFP